MKKRFYVFCGIFFSLLSACDKKNTYNTQGYIDTDLVYLSSIASGTLKELTIHRGDTLKKGDTVFILDLQPESDHLVEAQSNLKEAEAVLADLKKGSRPIEIDILNAQLGNKAAKLKLAAIKLKRIQKLKKEKVESASALDQAEADYDSQKKSFEEMRARIKEAYLGAREDKIKSQVAAVHAAKAVLQRIAWGLQQKTVMAPEDGQVFDIFYQEGETVSSNQPVVSLFVPRYTFAIFYVPTEILSSIHLHDTVLLQCDACKEPIKAFINFISPTEEYTPPIFFTREQRAKLIYQVRAALPLEATRFLHPGQPVDVVLSSHD